MLSVTTTNSLPEANTTNCSTIFFFSSFLNFTGRLVAEVLDKAFLCRGYLDSGWEQCAVVRMGWIMQDQYRERTGGMEMVILRVCVCACEGDTENKNT